MFIIISYHNKTRSTNLSLTENSTFFYKIRALKNSINTLRTNLIFPNYHKFLITPYWLLVLGIIEGEGWRALAWLVVLTY